MPASGGFRPPRPLLDQFVEVLGYVACPHVDAVVDAAEFHVLPGDFRELLVGLVGRHLRAGAGEVGREHACPGPGVEYAVAAAGAGVAHHEPRVTGHHRRAGALEVLEQVGSAQLPDGERFADVGLQFVAVAHVLGDVEHAEVGLELFTGTAYVLTIAVDQQKRAHRITPAGRRPRRGRRRSPRGPAGRSTP